MTFIRTIKNLFIRKNPKNKTYKTTYKTYKKKDNTIHFQKMNCSPAVKNKRINEQSCFTPEILKSIIDKYNVNHPDDKIIESDPKKAWYILKTKLSCKKEECWLNQLNDEAMKEKIKKFIFAPKHPDDWNDNPDEWLSNFDIFEVAKQYEVSYPNFKIIGPTTIDFDTKLPEQGGRCVLDDLCNFSLEAFIKAKKNKIGIVFNLDKHDQSGSHWVSLFIDIENKFMFFFDSANNGIPPEIWSKDKKHDVENMPLVNRIMKQGLELKHPIKFAFYNNNGITHQNGNTECGMYSLFFIITMLTGRTPFTKGYMSVKKRRDLFLKTKITDNVVFGFRKLYFND